jgi:hypothetical protein
LPAFVAIGRHVDFEPHIASLIMHALDVWQLGVGLSSVAQSAEGNVPAAGVPHAPPGVPLSPAGVMVFLSSEHATNATPTPSTAIGTIEIQIGNFMESLLRSDAKR